MKHEEAAHVIHIVNLAKARLKEPSGWNESESVCAALAYLQWIKDYCQHDIDPSKQRCCQWCGQGYYPTEYNLHGKMFCSFDCYNAYLSYAACAEEER